MKLIRFGQEGHEKPGIIVNDIWYDVRALLLITTKLFLQAMK